MRLVVLDRAASLRFETQQDATAFVALHVPLLRNPMHDVHDRCDDGNHTEDDARCKKPRDVRRENEAEGSSNDAGAHGAEPDHGVDIFVGVVAGQALSGHMRETGQTSNG